MFVSVVSVVILWYFQHLTQREQEAGFVSLAGNNVCFMEQARLPRSAIMADRIGRVMGAEVEFRERRGRVSYGEVLRDGVMMRVVYPLGQEGEVWFSKDVRADGVVPVWQRWDSRMLLMGFWLLALLFAWWLARKIARPVSALANLVPRMGADVPLDPLPPGGPAEIRMLARRFDETQRSIAEERKLRRRSERLAILGKMAASLAHEVRNPVSAIRLHGQLLERELAGEARQSAGHIIHEAGRIEELVLQWMFYAHPDSYSMGEIDVGDLVAKAVAGMEAQARHGGVSIRLENRSGGWRITGDGARLHQAFRNLLQNAVQAMPGGGLVLVRVDEGAIGIRDHGAGFQDESLARYGEPFCSGREGGMGLGVAVSKEILNHHGIQLSAENHSGGGALVRMIWADMGKEAKDG